MHIKFVYVSYQSYFLGGEMGMRKKKQKTYLQSQQYAKTQLSSVSKLQPYTYVKETRPNLCVEYQTTSRTEMS